MSLLIDALKKVEKAKNLKEDAITPQPDRTSDSSSRKEEDEELLLVDITYDDAPKTTSLNLDQNSFPKEEDEELLLVDITYDDAPKTTSLNLDQNSFPKEEDEELLIVEITDDEVPKTTSSNLSQTSESSHVDWNEELLPALKEVDSQPETLTHDSDQTDKFSALQPFSPSQDNGSETEPTMPHWDEEFLPQFQQDEEESPSNRSGEVADKGGRLDNSLPQVADKAGNKELLDDFLAENGKPSASFNSVTAKGGSESLDNANGNEAVNGNDEPLKNDEIELTQSTADKSNQTFDSLFQNEAAERPAELKFDLDEQRPAEWKEQRPAELKPDLDEQRPAEWKEERPTELKFVRDEQRPTERTADEERGFLETVGKESPQPEDARRVFAAGAPPTSSKRSLWLLGILGVLLVSMGGGYYYYSFSALKNRWPLQQSRTASTSEQTSNPANTEQSQSSPAPPPSQPTPSQPPPAPVESAKEPAQKQSKPVATADATGKPPAEPAGILSVAKSAFKSGVAKVAKLVKPKTTPTEPPAQSKPASKARSDDKPAAPIHQRPQSQPTRFEKDFYTQKSAQSRQPSTTSKQSQPTPKAQHQSPAAESSPLPDTPGIYTLRKQVTNRINTDLSTAYEAFQRGDNRAAQMAYQRALKQDNDNRDALLGLAALAQQRGNVRSAQYYYRRVLRLYPQDTYAHVGIINTLDNRSKESESQLKLLLEQAPQSAYIHFSLGNLYASQGRWAPAQQAYFDALRYDKSQADYAYNLAVSLDQLNQARVALTYYQRALQLAQIQPNQPVHFSQTAVRKRVRTIMAHTRGSALANLPAETF